MDLKNYLATPGVSGVQLAEKLKVAPAYLSQMVNGHRAISPERCVQIEQVTDGVVSRRDLRPDDWQAIWPELIGADAAPTIPDPTTEAKAGAA